MGCAEEKLIKRKLIKRLSKTVSSSESDSSDEEDGSSSSSSGGSDGESKDVELPVKKVKVAETKVRDVAFFVTCLAPVFQLVWNQWRFPKYDGYNVVFFLVSILIS